MTRTLRCAVLDDYQEAATSLADWSPVVTRANYATYYGEAVEDVAAFLDGSPVRVLP
ncbi:hypothetical protein ACIPUC_03555 [Streptomyces sp. LARHCF249]